MWWLRVASFMECACNFWRNTSALIDHLHQLQSFCLWSSTHIMSLICIKCLKFIDFVIRVLKLDFLREKICLRRVTLLNDNLYHKFSFELFIFQHRDELTCDLHTFILTSCLWLRSTAGCILSIKLFKKSLKLSLSFLYRNWPCTAPYLSSIPI